MKRLDYFINSLTYYDRSAILKEVLEQFNCDHMNTAVYTKVRDSGATYFLKYCTYCGKSCGLVRKADLTSSDINNAISDAEREKISDRYKERKQEYEAELDQKMDKAALKEFWDWYSEYLKSAEWQSLREKVFRRANNICEGCGEATAEQVHHLTYERVGREMVFDLVAVCKACHEKLHPEKLTDHLERYGLEKRTEL